MRQEGMTTSALWCWHFSDNSPRLKPGASQATTPMGVLSARTLGHSLEHVSCSIDVSIGNIATERAKVSTYRKCFLHNFIAIFAVLPELDGMPAVRFLEAREPDIISLMFFGGEKPFEGLREPISKHLHCGCWYMSPCPAATMPLTISSRERRAAFPPDHRKAMGVRAATFYEQRACFLSFRFLCTRRR